MGSLSAGACGMQLRLWAAALMAGALLFSLASAATDQRVASLLAAEAQSREKLITLNEELFNDYALSPDRPYHLVLFGSSGRLMNSPKLQLKALRDEFVYAAKAFKSVAENGERIFFVEMWHDHSAPVFSRLGLQALPAIVHWSPTQPGRPGKKVSLPEAAKCGQGISAYPWPAESIAEFVKGRTSLSFGAIDRPSFVKSPLFPLFALFALAAGGWVAWRLYNSWIVRLTWLWCLGSLVVYGFSTSGGMYNIIRGMPLYMHDRNGKVQWWMERSGQFGAEGFLMGSSYLFFSGCMSLMVYGLPHVRNPKHRSIASAAALLLGAVVGKGIFGAYASKTGMAMRSFFL